MGETYWKAYAKKVTARVNLAWWLQLFSPAFLLSSLAGACALLLVRRHVDSFPWLPFLLGFFAFTLLVGVICYLLTRKKFISQENAFVRIESSMGLRNALTAANDGIAPWPDPVDTPQDGLSWNRPRLLLPFLGACAFFTAGLFLPISLLHAETKDLRQPSAWEELQVEIEQLDEVDAIDEEYLEEFQKRLDELTSQDEENWFSHSSLEATDSLKSSHKSEVARLERNLLKAVQSLRGLQQTSQSQAAHEQLLADLDQAMQQLQDGAMKPNTALLNQLKGLGKEALKSLSPEQQKELRETMRKNAKQLSQRMGGSGKDGDWLDQLMAEHEKQKGGKDGKPKEPKGPG